MLVLYFYGILLCMMRKQRGFTLTECIITILLIAILATTAFDFFLYCQRFITNTVLELMASNFSRGTMETICWDPAIGNTTNPVADALPAGIFRDDHGGTRDYEITTDATGNYRVITVITEWN